MPVLVMVFPEVLERPAGQVVWS